VIYARISVSREESVSVERQVEAGRARAAREGWEVVGVFKERGVSASKTMLSERSEWQALLASPKPFEKVIVWKVDRLVRRVSDFVSVNSTLVERGAGLVCVEDPIDMTTAAGRAQANIVAVFAELEAATISARVKGARNHLIKAGRVVGGTIPYGWRSVENPNGSGKVLAKDPATIENVDAMVQKAMDGESIYAITKWASANASLPRASQKRRVSDSWNYSTVERLLRNPVLAGLTSHNPGNSSRQRGDDLLRDEAGVLVVNESAALLSVGAWTDLVARLDSRDSPQARPRSVRNSTSPLLSGLVTCGHCNVRMHRGTNQGRATLYCPRCHQSASNVDTHVAARLLVERADRPVYDFEVVARPDDSVAKCEEAINHTTDLMRLEDADLPGLLEKLNDLKSSLAAAKATGNRVIYRLTGETVGEAWETADPVRRHEVIASQAESIVLRRGKTGRYFDQARLSITWRELDLNLPDGISVPPKGRGSLPEGMGTWSTDEHGIYYTPA